MKKIIPLGIFLVFLLGLKVIFAQPEQPLEISGDTAYDIYYEVNAAKVDCAENVTIVATKTLGDENFLVIKYSGVSNRIGYIQLSQVRAILPSGAPKPKTFDLRKQY
jgi:hypothetical protein